MEFDTYAAVMRLCRKWDTGRHRTMHADSATWSASERRSCNQHRRTNCESFRDRSTLACERSRPKIEVSGAVKKCPKSSGAWAEREAAGAGTERRAGVAKIEANVEWEILHDECHENQRNAGLYLVVYNKRIGCYRWLPTSNCQINR